MTLKKSLGPYLSSGRLQQSPQPKGGGLFKADYWRVFDHKAANNYYPPTSFRVAALDGAFTTDQTNDPSALTVWGVFRPEDAGGPRVLLMHAFRKWLPL